MRPYPFIALLFLAACAPAPQCIEDTQCDLPMEYAIQSHCPYRAACAEGQCVVICPMMDAAPEPGELKGIACETDRECDCNRFASERMVRCACVNGECAALVR